MQVFDVTIVGGGSAGAVLAARLSADAQRRVLLLEAGQNFTPDSHPPVLTDANVVAGSPTFDWQYHTEDAARLGHDVPVPRGRVIRGSSAVNAAVAMRARPADFARWAQRGIEGWSWEEVLAAYKALENTPTGDDAWHGRTGPFPIRQRTAEENTPSMRAFVEASEAVGLMHVSDFNGATPVGKRLQAAWIKLEVPQCGYCQSGQLMSAAALLANTPRPDDADIDAAMAGNICRCGTYVRIREAIKVAADPAAVALSVTKS